MNLKSVFVYSNSIGENTMNMAEATAKRVGELLVKYDISQYELRKRTCLSEKTLIRLLHNRTKDINSSTVFLIANAFGLTMQEFYASPLFNPDNIEV